MDELHRRITDDGSTTLYSARYGQTFHSRHGAVAESLHVFVEGSGTAARLRDGAEARVLEVGFGTGLNFLLTARAARVDRGRLHYRALERELLTADTVASLGYEAFAAEELSLLLALRRDLPERPEVGRYGFDLPFGSLELTVGDATAADLPGSAYDAVYHDGFSPDENPELWSEEFLGRLAASLVPGGALVTYTVKGTVRRKLAAAGLQVARKPGPEGGKPEMLRAQRPE